MARLGTVQKRWRKEEGDRRTEFALRADGVLLQKLTYRTFNLYSAFHEDGAYEWHSAGWRIYSRRPVAAVADRLAARGYEVVA